MQDLFGFIIPILAVVFWLFGLKKTNEEENKQQSSQQPTQQRTITVGETASTTTQTADYQPMETMTDPNQPTFSQQKQKQMKNLEEKIQRAEAIREKTHDQEMGIHDAIKDGSMPNYYQKNDKKAVLISVKNNLTPKGVVQGLIMSEVLGPPRAYQKRKIYRRYRS